MTVSIRRMSVGTGYEYLLRSVARGDGVTDSSSGLTRYYAESGTPRGYFLGAGLAGLNDGNGIPEGSEVTEQMLFNLLGMLADPITGQPLGNRPANWPTPLAERIRLRVALLPEGLGPQERAASIAKIESEEAQRERTISRPVAGFDLTFSVPKSVSAVWAISDGATQQAIYDAHRDAVKQALVYAEKTMVFTRTGFAGSVQAPVRGVIATAFDHWDSRAGDPHLHTHVVVANRVQGLDGKWRTLDSRTLHQYVVALSELHEGVLQDLLSERLGYGWDERTRRLSNAPRYDITGVPDELIQHFSRRSTDIDAAANDLVMAFAAKHGRQPTTDEILALRQQATLATRPDKELHSLAEQTETWRERARPFVGGDTVAFASGLASQNPLPALTAATINADLLNQTAQLALANVAAKRATFTHANVLAEVHRQLHGVRFTTPDERLSVAEQMTTTALAEAINLTVDATTISSARYTSPAVLAAESRLLAAGRSVAGPVAAEAPPLERSGTELGADQAAVVTAIATSGRELDLLVGPAGSGKTTTLAALRQVWEGTYGEGSVVGLAPSAAAAEVLSAEIGVDTENTSKWIHEAARQAERLDRIRALFIEKDHAATTAQADAIGDRIDAAYREYLQWKIGVKQLVIIDEAGLAGTLHLDQIVTQAIDAGAKVLLVGDWGQLGAIQAGGAFTMLVNDRPDTPELSTVRRFENEWERDASLQLRIGDPKAIEAYTANERVHAGARDQALDQLYTAWRDDTDSGLSSLMIAADSEAVTALNLRARADRIAAGEVQPGGVPIHEGVAGIGDRIVTRQNDRRLAADGRWVRNGDHWTVQGIGRDGSLTVQLEGGSNSITLPATYVRSHVELGYAATAHRAQGRTVDTAHALIDARSTRETLYVAATRGRGENHLYVDLEIDLDPDTGHDLGGGDASEILEGALRRSSAEQSAHTFVTDRSLAETAPPVDPTMASFLRTDLFPRPYNAYDNEPAISIEP